MIILFVYLIVVAVTWVYAGVLTGQQFARTQKANPQMPIAINWVSVFFQGLTWIAFWSSLVGEKLEKRRRPDKKIVMDKS
jgi:protoheme ferro-lyase